MENFPAVFAGVILDQGVDYVRGAKDRQLQKLSEDWAARHIEASYVLRDWIDKRGQWFPERLAERLGVSAELAERLLWELGYERNDRGIMVSPGSSEALKRRKEWLRAEQRQLEHKLEADDWAAALLEDRPKRSFIGWIRRRRH
jgi:hypothetical protein